MKVFQISFLKTLIPFCSFPWLGCAFLRAWGLARQSFQRLLHSLRRSCRGFPDLRSRSPGARPWIHGIHCPRTPDRTAKRDWKCWKKLGWNWNHGWVNLSLTVWVMLCRRVEWRTHPKEIGGPMQDQGFDRRIGTNPSDIPRRRREGISKIKKTWNSRTRLVLLQ